jgi:hypothetical protein
MIATANAATACELKMGTGDKGEQYFTDFLTPNKNSPQY